VIALLTWSNSRGLEYGKIVQNVFTTAKVGALAALIIAGVLWAGRGRNAEASANFTNFFRFGAFDASLGVAAGSIFGLIVAVCVRNPARCFSADAWHDVTSSPGGPRSATHPAQGPGDRVHRGGDLYVLVNVVYLMVLPLEGIQNAPSDRVATAVVERMVPVTAPS